MRATIDQEQSQLTQLYKVLMRGCGHVESRRMRPETAGIPWTPEAVVQSSEGACCKACRTMKGEG